MKHDFDPERLKRILGENEPQELQGYLVNLSSEREYIAGSTVPLIGRQFVEWRDGLLVPKNARLGPAPIDFGGTYLTLEEYVDIPATRVIADCIQSVPRIELLAALATLNHIAMDPSLIDDFREFFRSVLLADARQRFDIAMRSDGETKRQFLARQHILNAMKIVLTNPTAHEPQLRGYPLILAALLIHATASALYSREQSSLGQLTGTPAPLPLAMEIIRSQIFNRDDYVLAARERHVRLWRQFGQQVSRNPFGKPPTELLQAATGLELETILALGMGLYAIAKEWTPSQTVRIPSTFSTHTSKDQVDAFLEMVSGDLSTLARDVGGIESPWNFLAFQHKPVLREGDSLLVLDERFLLDRVMFVLYWDVANHIKQNYGDAGFSDWTSVYGEMVELLVEDHLRGLSLSLTTTERQKVFFTEEDLQKQSQGKTCDVVLDYGTHLILAEIFSGRLTVGTRVHGNELSFTDDTEKMVLKKALQLNDTAECILKGRMPLFPTPTSPSRRILPVIVLAEMYPVNPITQIFVDSLIRKEKLFEDGRIEKLAIIDIADLEILEGLAERGHSPADVLLSWKSSPLAAMPLHVYAMNLHGDGTWKSIFPSRLDAMANTTFRELAERLGFSDEDWDERLKQDREQQSP